MRRVGHLIEKIAELDNLYLAFLKAKRGKQFKREVIDFVSHLDDNIAELQKEIVAGHINVGDYRYFRIYDPKERLICAASFRERILLHAIMNVCHRHFEKNLIHDTYATRPGKGTYKALDRAVKAASHYQYLAKLDFRKYFDSIDHTKLLHLLGRLFKDYALLGLFARIVDSYHENTGKGLPIGNLTSQYFANYYLSELDHWAKEQLHVPFYIRYMDDILLAANDKSTLSEADSMIRAYAERELFLSLKPPIIHRSAVGVVFLGYRVLSYHRLLSGRGKRRFRTKLLHFERCLEEGLWSEHEYAMHVLPLLSFTQHAQSKRFRWSCMKIIDNRNQNNSGKCKM